MLLSSELRGRIEDIAYYFEGTAKAEAAADLLMLTQGWRRYSMVEQNDTVKYEHPIETEQCISGYVKRKFDPRKPLNLTLFVPRTGYQETYTLKQSNRFNLTGLDFVEGATYNLQATKDDDGILRRDLIIDELKFPKLEGFGRHATFTAQDIDNVVQATPEMMRRIGRWEFELPEFVVKGRKIKPMNRANLEPDRFYAEGDPLLDMAHTMAVLVGRWGLSFGMVRVEIDGKTDSIRALRKWNIGGYVPITVYIDDTKIEDYELSEVENIDPHDIKQIEYFTSVGMVGATGFRIYTKSPTDFSYFKYNRPPSFATVRQLGYKRPVEFYSPNHALIFDVPTLYWNPHLTSDGDKQSELLLPSIKKGSKYSVTVEGVSDEGEIVKYQSTITGPYNSKE